MKLVAIARVPARPEEAARAMVDAAGVTLAEARMRLAPEPPAIIARLESSKAEAVVAALRRAGVAALSIDARVQSDGERTIARLVALTAAGASFTPRFGDPMDVSWSDVVAVMRGQRASRSVVERSDKSRRFSVTTAVATGGLKMTRTSLRTERSSVESTEQVILVYAQDGRTALLSEHQVDFSCLGAAMQPSSTGNMAELALRLRENAKSAFYDERLLRLGRRPLPFQASGESRSQTAMVTATHTDTSGSLDVLAEVLRQAVAERLVP